MKMGDISKELMNTLLSANKFLIYKKYFHRYRYR